MITKIIPHWREKIVEPLEELQERLRQQWLSLNARERLILSILAGFMCLLLSALVIKEATTFFFRSEFEAQNNLKNIERIQRISQDLLSQRSDIARYDRLKEKRGETFKFSNFIESEAKKFGIGIAKMAPVKAAVDDKAPEQEWVEVQLKDANLDALMKFFQSAEEMLGVKIVEMNIKPQFSDSTKLEATAIFANLHEL